MSTTVPGLQKLIDTCYVYAKAWRFNFGIKKSKCMVAGQTPWRITPTWSLNGQDIETANSVEILGISFSSAGNSKLHFEKRMQNCRKSFYNLNDLGMAFPGLNPEVKAYLWRSVCLPTLLYGCDSICVSNSDLNRLQSVQGTLIKQALGLGKRSHHSALLEALNIDNVQYNVNQRSLSMFYKVMSYDSLARDLSTYLLSLYMAKNTVVPDTIVSRVLSMGLSPVRCVFTKCYVQSERTMYGIDGTIDSLRHILSTEQCIKPYSDEHLLLRLLTRTF